MAGKAFSSYSDDDDGSMSDINVTPLVDVVLVLLIVFMITVPAIVGSAHVKVDLPETSAVASESENLPLVFALRREAEDVVIYLNDNPITKDGVREMFAKYKPGDDQRVSLSADKGIPYGRVIEVVDLLQEVGLKNLALDTQHVDSK